MSQSDFEHASDLWSGDDLVKHFEKPWAMVGRVRCVEHGPSGEPEPLDAEVIVRLPRWPFDPVEGAIDLAIGGPFLPWADRAANDGHHTSAGAGLSPAAARGLGHYLIEAADRAEQSQADASEPPTRTPKSNPSDGEWARLGNGWEPA